MQVEEPASTKLRVALKEIVEINDRIAKGESMKLTMPEKAPNLQQAIHDYIKTKSEKLRTCKAAFESLEKLIDRERAERDRHDEAVGGLEGKLMIEEQFLPESQSVVDQLKPELQAKRDILEACDRKCKELEVLRSEFRTAAELHGFDENFNGPTGIVGRVGVTCERCGSNDIRFADRGNLIQCVKCGHSWRS